MKLSLPTLSIVGLAKASFFKFLLFIKYWLYVLLLGIFIGLPGGCNQKPNSVPGLERISVDLSESRTGKLSEFFEPSIEYIWLEDDSEEAQLNAGLHKILFHENRIYTLDIYGCKCIHIFDTSGKYLSKISAYGEGPGQYLDFDDAAFVDEEIVLLGVFPRKIMWFSLEGEFLRELSFRDPIGPGVFSAFDQRLYLFTDTRDPGDYFVKSFNKSFQDTIQYFPFHPERLYGNFSGRNFFQKSTENLYFGMTYLDTIYQVDKGNFMPKLVFDFGKYGQDLDEIKRLDPGMESLDFINNRARLYFRGQYLISEKHLFTLLAYEKKAIFLFFDREQNKTHLIEKRLTNDIDGGYDAPGLQYSFKPGKVGLKVPGRDLYETLMEKKNNMGKAEFENWVKNQGRNFAETAMKARASENPVLIVYTLK
ncbi:6-bladed beta-propeller [Cyclobacterium sp.]|uniref:6-bladed beta-propeller n=1 Tax=Cyclobacterium sp. TaxID=1966343 RepID=UPI0019C5855B|nr:6-bladed beta-propeller [Cyclobacterium sp.]MBD3628431.1 6-bladed beta-propeller [Cyclobacterium sp.]